MRSLLAIVACAWTATAATASEVDARRAKKHYDEGVASMGRQAWEPASESFKAAIAADRFMVLAHYNLGQSLMALKRYEEAVAAYGACKQAYADLSSLSEKEWAERDRRRRDEVRNLRDDLQHLAMLKDANTMRIQTQLEDRLRMLESMESREGQRVELPAEVPLALGSAYFRQQKLEDAEREYREATKINPKLGAAHNNLAVICLLTKRPQDAAAELVLAEKNGFPINPNLKRDIEKAAAAQP